jgi:CheY-like chemotaxis protein
MDASTPTTDGLTAIADITARRLAPVVTLTAFTDPDLVDVPRRRRT